ncbi:MAG: ABC transporter ATP-binding protein [Vicinamibacterales bacterium]
MLKVEHVSKQYATPRGPLSILEDVDVTLEAGQAAAITGPSGSGKSTLLYLLGALEPPTAGTITLGGENPYALDPRAVADFRNRHIGFVFQDHCLLPQCSVLENVLVPTLIREARDGEPAVDRARMLIERVGLTHRAEHRPAELSGGEKQRVAIARALIRQPRLVLCDEPTGNLDPDTAAKVADLLLELHRQQETILIAVTHSASLAARFPVQFALRDRRLLRLDPQVETVRV